MTRKVCLLLPNTVVLPGVRGELVHVQITGLVYLSIIKSSCASIVKLQVRTHPCRIRRLSWSDSASAWQTWLLSTAGPIYLSIYPLSCWWSFWFREGASNHRPDALAGAAPTMIQFSSPTTTWTSPNEGTRVWQVAAQRRRALAPWVRGRDDLGAHGGVGAVESPGIAAYTHESDRITDEQSARAGIAGSEAAASRRAHCAG